MNILFKPDSEEEYPTDYADKAITRILIEEINKEIGLSENANFVKNYNPRQPRDELGRWASTGAGSNAKENDRLENSLSLMAKAVGQARKNSNFKYKSSEELILKQGINFTPKEKPANIKQGKPKECYRNASKLAYESGYTYVEGYAHSSLDIDLPIAHAWVVDTEGNVIDNTWEEVGRAYRGIPIKTDVLIDKMMESGVYGIVSGAEPNLYLKEGVPGSDMADWSKPQQKNSAETHANFMEIVENYNPNQPRDDRGRWTSTGASGLTPSQALYDYQDYAYKDINDYLRLSAKVKAGEKLDEYDQKRYDEITSNNERLQDTKDHIAAIDEAFDGDKAKVGGAGHRIDSGIATDIFMSTDIGDMVAKLKAEGNLPMNHDEWYGAKSEYGKQLEAKIREKLIGTNHTFTSYISTDADKNAAIERFSQGNSKIEPTGMETYINISSSKVKTLRVNDFTGMDSYMGQENPEDERLFNRDSTFEIYSVSIVPMSSPGYSGPRGEGFQLQLYMKDPNTENSLDKDLNYNPRQPRDEMGRWTSTGSSSKYMRDAYKPNGARTFTSEQDMASYTQGYHKGKPPEQQYKAMNTWVTTSGCVAIQNTARGENDNYNEEVKGLDEATDSNTLKDDINLFRGMAITKSEVENLAKKGQFKTQTFFTTALNAERVEQYFAGHGAGYDVDKSDYNKPTMFRIKAKSGTKGVFTDARWPDEDYHNGLGEFIPSRSNEYEVKDVVYMYDNDKNYTGAIVDMEII